MEELKQKLEDLSRMIEQMEKSTYQPSSEEEKREYYDYLSQLYGNLEEVNRLLQHKKQELCGI